MDYEKKYKEALQKAKQRLDCDKNGFISTDKALLLSMFPELKESEDEKIRKELIDFLQETIDNVGKSPNIWTMSNAKNGLLGLKKNKVNKFLLIPQKLARMSRILPIMLNRSLRLNMQAVNTMYLKLKTLLV